MKQADHFRRCLVCGEVSHEANGRVECCKKCGKHLAPFFYYDERQIGVLDTGAARIQVELQSYDPIVGLSLYW